MHADRNQAAPLPGPRGKHCSSPFTRPAAVQDEAVIAGSLAQLNAGQATALLDALVERLQVQPQQAARLVAWLRTLLADQGPTLTAVPAAQV